MAPRPQQGSVPRSRWIRVARGHPETWGPGSRRPVSPALPKPPVCAPAQGRVTSPEPSAGGRLALGSASSATLLVTRATNPTHTSRLVPQVGLWGSDLAGGGLPCEALYLSPVSSPAASGVGGHFLPCYPPPYQLVIHSHSHPPPREALGENCPRTHPAATLPFPTSGIRGPFRREFAGLTWCRLGSPPGPALAYVLCTVQASGSSEGQDPISPP